MANAQASWKPGYLRLMLKLFKFFLEYLAQIIWQVEST